MNLYLLSASVLTFITAVAHSVLGEKMLLRPLFSNENLPAILSNRDTTRMTIRFAWHLIAIFLVAVSTLLFYFAGVKPTANVEFALCVFFILFTSCSALALVIARFRYPLWLIFLLTALFIWYGSEMRAGFRTGLMGSIWKLVD